MTVLNPILIHVFSEPKSVKPSGSGWYLAEVLVAEETDPFMSNIEKRISPKLSNWLISPGSQYKGQTPFQTLNSLNSIIMIPNTHISKRHEIKGFIDHHYIILSSAETHQNP